MAQTKVGGKKAATTNLKNDPDFYRRIGAIGGSKPTTKPKGFAANPELARIAGKKGGKISRRPKKVEEPEQRNYLKRILKKFA